MIPDFVKNLSDEQFTTDELKLLNKGFSFALQPQSQVAVDAALINIETALKQLDDDDVKVQIRCEAADKINNLELSKLTGEMSDNWKATKSLIEKKDRVVYTKADKSNNIVILNKSDYIEITEKFIKDGQYTEVKKDPLLGMIRRTKDAVKRAAEVISNGKFLTRKLHVSNPVLPRLYTQLKLHKPGQKVRPITSNINAPTEKVAQYLLDRFNEMPNKFESAAIKNSIEFVDNVKHLEINENEIQVSFDVESLFPNVPMNIVMDMLRDWLITNNLPKDEIEQLINLTHICMNENWFQFNEKYFRQDFGCCMGSPLSPFLANLFMSNLETKLKVESNFPRIWYRYVDDVWAVIKRQSVRSFLNKLNNTGYPSIKFTHEEEKDGKINFLDLEISNLTSIEKQLIPGVT
ncbi:uncharacterized protein LOC116351323 [Contarinia nasturtii]|uniref:uncharacterized protein LOC116351323 n=1 Tax=Contarinia nasturtii TaxID=265458 RepID=UPI0012D44110|nr:uncharacterized protein LOC116351323 [Contarinia nasturtii]